MTVIAAPSPSHPVADVGPVDRRALGWFVGVLAAITTVAMLPLWLARADADALNAVVPLLSWAPAAAAVAAFRRSARRTSFLRWAAIRPALSWRIAATWAVVLGVFVLIPAASTAIGVAAGVVEWQPTDEAWSLVPLVVPFALLALLTVTGEEIGWRGALQTMLAPLGAWRASIVVAVVWSAWHLPLTLGYASSGGFATRDVVATSVDLVLAGVVLSAARIASSSMWPAAWAHALLNSTLVFAESNLVTPANELADGPFWVMQAITWAVVAVAAVCSMLVAVRMRRTR